jgi:hypothetical protein
MHCVGTYTTYCRNKFHTTKPNGLLLTVMITKVKKKSHGSHDITLTYKNITLLKFHFSSRIVTIYHFESRNVASLVILSPYVYTHSPCYCESVYEKYNELYRLPVAPCLSQF